MSASVTHGETATRPIRIWLYTLCGLIFAMVLVGGATRLTDSGLSITEWQLVSGILPPLGQADWQAAFEKYQQIPEYRVVNEGMSLAEFKVIYWWEWTHRFLGRFIGFAFLVPFLFFWARGYINRALWPRLAVMFVLGALQGALGWFMVQSGLVERTDVSQYRLAAHLALAVAIFGYALWVALDLTPQRKPDAAAPQGVAQAGTLSAAGLTALVFLQIVLGALVAGLDAGMGYNTWPLMDGALVPSGLGAMQPWYLNLFENAMTVQFDHRMAAYAVIAWAVLHAVWVVRAAGEGTLAVTGGLVTLAAIAQGALGVWTLLARVPLALGLLHQAGALVLFALALLHLHRMRTAWHVAVRTVNVRPSPAPAQGRR